MFYWVAIAFVLLRIAKERRHHHCSMHVTGIEHLLLLLLCCCFCCVLDDDVVLIEGIWEWLMKYSMEHERGKNVQSIFQQFVLIGTLYFGDWENECFTLSVRKVHEIMICKEFYECFTTLTVLNSRHVRFRTIPWYLFSKIPFWLTANKARLCTRQDMNSLHIKAHCIVWVQ